MGLGHATTASARSSQQAAGTLQDRGRLGVRFVGARDISYFYRKEGGGAFSLELQRGEAGVPKSRGASGPGWMAWKSAELTASDVGSSPRYPTNNPGICWALLESQTCGLLVGSCCTCLVLRSMRGTLCALKVWYV